MGIRCASKGCLRYGFYPHMRDVPEGVLTVYYCEDHDPAHIEERASKARTHRVVEAFRSALPDLITDEEDRERADYLLDSIDEDPTHG